MRYGLEHLLRRHLQLVLHVYRAGCQEGVNAGRLCTADGVPCRLDVLLTAACQRADGSAAYSISDCCDSSSIAGRSSGKACFNDINLEGFELLCNLDLLIQVHAAAGRLLTVTQRRIKNLNCSSHGILSSPIQNFTGLTGTKKASSLNPPRYHSCCRSMVRPLYAHLTMRSPCNGGYPFPPTGPKDFQRTAPGRVSLLPDAALHQPATLCGQG